ncbi:MAG TPA: TraB/GumN family protein [Rhodanobacter sp.]|nr:TraB/GumN family protein [Rhodanobacter sp.]
MKATLLTRLLFLLVLLLPVGAIAAPALWVVTDAHATIYLFGTVHLLPNDTAWRFPALEAALAKSRTLYIEITDDDPANMATLVLEYGVDLAHPLADRLDAAQRQRLTTAAAQAGVPGGMRTLNMMRPWLAALTLATAPLLKAGLDPQHGVDKQLKALMLADGKTVLGLETAGQQIHFLADMPEPTQLEFLRATLKDVDQGPAVLTELIDAWKIGDVDRIARIEEQDMRQQSPALYQRLLVERNRAWATKIAALLRHPGTIFIAVGAAHLAGPDSVQAQLQKLGIKTVRQ